MLVPHVPRVRQAITDKRPVLALQKAPDAFESASDQDLLNRFAARGDEAAFGELVRRHCPMLLRLCRRVLHCDQDAEDVCQAAFLLLAQQAASPRWHASVNGWLFKVAHRLSLKQIFDSRATIFAPARAKTPCFLRFSLWRRQNVVPRCVIILLAFLLIC
jgi:Sigma-70 region 2